MKKEKPKPSPWPLYIGAALFFLLGVLIYWPAWHSGFIWDDDAMLTNNRLVKAADGLRFIWFSTVPVDYFPVTYSSLWLEYHLWGLAPIGFHLTNVLLHAGSALLLWRILARLKIPGAIFAALLFLVHPVNVESVAWIAERKNTLCLFFYFLSLYFYLRAEKGRGFYLLSLAAFLLSLLSKPASVMLPIILLGLAWWRQGRIGKNDWLRSLPFFGLALVLGLITIWFQNHRAIGGEVIHHQNGLMRLTMAGRAVWFYLWKAIYPVNLSFVYPEWKMDGLSLLAWLPGLALVAVFAVLGIFYRSWGRTWPVVAGYFVLMLFPVLGFFDIYFMKYSWVADHWQYLALPIVVVVVAALLDRAPFRMFRRLCLVVLIVLCGVLNWRQQGIYQDEEALWQDTLRKNPECILACNNLGLILENKGQLAEASELFARSLQIKPVQVEAHDNLGSLYYTQGQYDQAMEEFQKAQAVDPNVYLTHYNIGNVLEARGRTAEAVAEYREALRLNPDYAEAHNNLGFSYATHGRPEEALAEFKLAVAAQPDYDEAMNNLGGILVKMGRPGEALPVLLKVMEIRPNYADGRFNLGNVYSDLGKATEALEQYQAALQINPGMAAAHYRMGDVYLRLGKIDEAFNEFSTVLAQEPGSAEAHYQLAAVLDAKHDRAGKIEHLHEVVRLKPDWPEALNELAWTLATDARSLSEAVSLARQAHALALAAGQTNLATQIQGRLESYRKKVPRP